jgi:predicted nucleotidyltransferase
MNGENRERLKIVAKSLGDMCNQVVFLGGATVELYATSPAAPTPRPTLDVDCIVEITSITQLHALDEKLRRRGFVNDRSEGAPICRWICQGIKVDVMPTRAQVLGFTNEWYEEGFRHSQKFSLDDKVEVKIPEVPYFLATKVAALHNRGMTDLRTSSDFEDIVYVLRNRDSLVDEIRAADKFVKDYLVDAFTKLLSIDIVDEAIYSVLDYGEPVGARSKIRSIMEKISASGSADSARGE